MKSRFSFSAAERVLWGVSVGCITVTFLLFDRENYLSFIASLIGVSSLIFCAKGNPIGQLLMIVFSALYSILAFSYRYYGEMITYLGMTLPMAILSLVAWLRHPYRGNKAEVAVSRVSRRHIGQMTVFTVVVTGVCFVLLDTLGTAHLVPSTISVATSFAAAYLTFRRSPYFALAYAANDVVLIVLWVLAAIEDVTYVSVVACFAVFLANDIYGFISWRKMQQRQRTGM